MPGGIDGDPRGFFEAAGAAPGATPRGQQRPGGTELEHPTKTGIGDINRPVRRHRERNRPVERDRAEPPQRPVGGAEAHDAPGAGVGDIDHLAGGRERHPVRFEQRGGGPELLPLLPIPRTPDLDGAPVDGDGFTRWRRRGIAERAEVAPLGAEVADDARCGGR